MNLYFLVEGRRTERKVYPKWLGILLPQLQQVTYLEEVTHNHFYLFSGNGYPSILDNHLANAITEINDMGNIDYLIMCIDADEATVAERKQEVLTFMAEHQLELHYKTKFVLIIQNRCIETWCLGNQRIFKRNPEFEPLKEYVNFYNVQKDDPEKMGKLVEFETHSQFHEDYLSELLHVRNIAYTKKNPKGIVEAYYLQELENRVNTTNHIQTFKVFLDLCKQIKSQLKS